MRITAACPEQLQSDANQLAMCLALGPDDINTYKGLNWQDSSGNLYACASWLTNTQWIAMAQQTLVRPTWDTDNIIDMDVATRAQGKLVFNDTAIIATPDTLTACLGDNGLLVIKGMGLTSVEAEDGFMGE
jgi:hypothetical protein